MCLAAWSGYRESNERSEKPLGKPFGTFGAAATFGAEELLGQQRTCEFEKTMSETREDGPLPPKEVSRTSREGRFLGCHMFFLHSNKHNIEVS